MRSNTLIPLLQFTNWWGIDPWYASGIDKEEKTGTNSLKLDPSNDCICMLQNPWDSNQNWSRGDLIDMLKWAEEFFVMNVGYYPAPFFIENEKKALKKSVYKNGSLALIKPKYSCNFSEFGSLSLVLQDTVTLTRDDTGTIRDIFSVTFAVPSGTVASDIRVYFTQADGGYTGDPSFNDHEYEIRPIDISISGTSATISGPAYLFKKPSLDEATQCVYHVLTTYVEDVVIYLKTVDYCNQGDFVSNGDCSEVPCTTELHNVCFRSKTVGNQFYGYAFPATCTGNTISNLSLTKAVSEIQYNYLTGIELSGGSYAKDEEVRIISGLAIGLASCVKDWCECSICPKEKVKYYKDTPKYRSEVDKDNTEYNQNWQLILSRGSINYLDGLEPNNGILQFARYDKRNKCNSFEGSSL